MKSTKDRSVLKELRAIRLNLGERLKDPEFRREWFRAELESSVPEAFRALRERRAMTQGDLAIAMGTQQPAVSRFERSTEPVWEFDFLLRMSEAMDGRLRVVIEAAEDVLDEYEDLRPAEPRASVLDGVAERKLNQLEPSATASQSGIEGYGAKARRGQQDRGIDDRETEARSALSS